MSGDQYAKKISSVYGPQSNAAVCISSTKKSERGCLVNKFELIEAIAKSADISKAAAGRALDGAVAAIQVSLKKGAMVTLVGFGTFYVGQRAARSGRNPRTGAAIKIKAAKVPKFRAGKALKDAVN
jgi:DNA-binding protein HU-beta